MTSDRPRGVHLYMYVTKTSFGLRIEPKNNNMLQSKFCHGPNHRQPEWCRQARKQTLLRSPDTDTEPLLSNVYTCEQNVHVCVCKILRKTHT